MSKKFSKSLPYMVQGDSNPIKTSAAWVRKTFALLMAKRLPTVLYGGFKHGFIPQYIQTHKIEYPYFLKIDIQKFYPSLNHHHLTVEAQLAYKKLLGLPYVPKGFKKQFLPALHAFFGSLSIQNKGLPLNSSMSKALACLVYVPFF